MRDSSTSEVRYTISEAAEQTGLTPDTLRYYEKIGLILSPGRDVHGQRAYSEEDLGKIRFLNQLKRTNMPLRKIREYVQRYAEQDESGCYELLDEHGRGIEAQLAELTETLELIHYKLKHFQQIKDGKFKEENAE
ncbi:MerR family transcriptional regulator [Paenibacillus sp. NFR01]|uniref:MerR family transcriptional regulator n=1 Tax=Paenibacillus sp. NFR01 TaxID=1566279 RepID=UPI0008B4DFE1|nr:MerR family transcriptional regulator [Paenibacillus sp. NFR01]SET14117.1 transcriptional regulator, MerR family [Paenibacillus sp. NFR01]